MLKKEYNYEQYYISYIRIFRSSSTNRFGFENTFAALDNASHLLTATSTAFPPVNIIEKDEYNFIIELAIAGYKQDEIEITAERNSLKVTGKKAEEEETRNYLVKGIVGRKFSRQFVLSDTVVVS